MRLRGGGLYALFALAVLQAGCTNIPGTADYAMAPANAPVVHDPSFRVNELKGGMTKPQLDAIYGTRLVREGGDPTYDLYQVESANAQPGAKREQLALWVIDGKLATWGIVEANGPIAMAAPPPEAVPPAPAETRAGAQGKYGVQIAARSTEAEARAAIDQMRRQYSGLLARQWATIYRVDLPKGVFFRAVVGPFASEKQASDLCNRLKAAGAQCLIRGG